MKKTIKKYYFGGQDSPCGEGTIWDDQQQKCVPTQWYTKPVDPIFTPRSQNAMAISQQQGDAVQTQDFNIDKDIVNLNKYDNNGHFIPHNKYNADAVDQGYNYDSDGQYRKTVMTEDPNKLEFSNGFKALNFALDATSIIGGKFNDVANSKEERQKLLKARYGQSKYNVYEGGINNVPAYFKKGGENKNPKSLAAAILNQGELGGHKLTAKQKKHFKFVLEGKIPIDGHIKDAKAKDTYAVGGQDEEELIHNPQEESMEQIPNAELEKGEIFQTQQGDINKVSESEPTHEDGGSMQQNVHRVLEDTGDKRTDIDSKLLRIKPDEAEQLVGFKPKKTLTHSKLYEQAIEFHGKKFKKQQKLLDQNLDYVNKQNGGLYAENSLEQNIKLLESMPTEKKIFDAIFDHQEAVKQKYSIDQFKNGGMPEAKYGIDIDKKKKAVKITDPKDWTYIGEEDNKKYYEKPGTNSTAYVNVGGKVELGKRGHFTAEDILNNPDQFRTFHAQMQGAPDDVKRDAAAKLYGQGIMPSKYTINTSTDPQYAFMDNPALTNNTNPNIAPADKNVDPTAQPIDYTLNKSGEASKFNEPLRWYDVAGGMMNYISSVEREPVDLEQLRRDPIKVHELNALPTLLQNQGDYNTALEELPTNGVGFANQANLQAQKYKVNNDVLGQYENQNKTRYDQVDQYNDQAQFQLKQLNLGLRDQFTERVLQGKEVQRQSKLNALDDLFTKVAQNRKLNREGQLVMELTPYFDQYGRFNGNKYNVTSNSGLVTIIDKATGQKVKQVTQQQFDEMGALKGTKITNTQQTK